MGEELFHADRQTIKKLNVAFRNFANVPKNVTKTTVHTRNQNDICDERNPRSRSRLLELANGCTDEWISFKPYGRAQPVAKTSSK